MRWWNKEDDGEKGTGDKKEILLKSKMMAGLTTGRRPDNWRQSITVVNSQEEEGQKGGSQRERKMLAGTFRAQLTRSRTGIVQACFQHNINFPVIKSPTWRPPVLTALSAPREGPLRPPEERVPVGSGLLGSPTHHLYRTIHSIHTCNLPFNLSAASTHHSTGMSNCRMDQSGKCVCD